MALLPLAGAAMLGSGLFNAVGAIKSNKSAKDAKTRLGWQVENLRELADPVGAGLVQGWQPGGFLRSMSAAAGSAPYQEQASRGLGNLRSSGYRYGGGGGGLARTLAGQIQTGGALGSAQAANAADLQGMDVLGRIQAQQFGYDRAFAPETIYSNPYAWMGEASQQFARGVSGGRSY